MDEFDFEGLGSLESVGGLYLDFDDGLTSLCGLDRLTSIEGGIVFRMNLSLASLEGLDRLTSLSGSIFLLAWNEDRAVTAIKALDDGLHQVVEAPASPVDPTRQGKLLHVSGPRVCPARRKNLRHEPVGRSRPIHEAACV